LIERVAHRRDCEDPRGDRTMRALDHQHHQDRHDQHASRREGVREVPGGPPRLPRDLGARVLVAVPAAAVTVLLVYVGRLPLALALGALGGLAFIELRALMDEQARVPAAGALVVAAMPIAALYGGPEAIVLALATSPAVVFAARLGRQAGGQAALAIGVTLLGIVWIGGAFGHGMLLRELPHGAGLAIDVLLGTFLGDTAAHLGGSAFGRRQLAPGVSPNKTVEGLLSGVVVATLSVWLAALLFQDWLGGWEALVLGVAVALAAPVGDLLESLLKRQAGVKDSGRLFGVHGGVLDRVDAVLFTVVAGYYASAAVA